MKARLTTLILLALSMAANAATIEGQVFIVTKGGNSIKLGLVEVCAYPKDETKESITAVTDRLAPDREKIKDLDNSMTALTAQIRAASEQAQKLCIGGEYGTPAYDQAFAASRRLMSLSLDLARLSDLVDSRRRYLFSALPYLSSLPKPIGRAKTDADGNFAITVPDEGNVVIGAIAHRLAGDSSENYSWFVTPDRDGAPKLALSNDNMTSEAVDTSVLHTLYNVGEAPKITADDIRAEYRKLAATYNLPPLPRDQPSAKPVAVNVAVPAAVAPVQLPPLDKILVTTKRPVEVPRRTGKAIIPAGTKLELISRGSNVVQVRYENGSEIIPLDATDLATR